MNYLDSPLDTSQLSASLRRGINHVTFHGDLMALSDVRMNVRVTRKEEVVLERAFCSSSDKIRPTERVRGLRFSADGQLLFVAAGDTVTAVEVATGLDVWSYTPPRSFGFLIISPMALATSRSGDVAAAFDNGSVAVWTEDGIMRSLWHHNDSPRTLEFMLDGQSVFGTDSFSLCQWDIETRKRKMKLQLPARVFGMALSPHLPLAATRTLHGIDIWDLESQEISASFKVGPGLPLLTFHPREMLLAYGERNAVVVADLRGNQVQRCEVPEATVLSLAFAEDGLSLGIGCSDDAVRLWLPQF